MSVHTWGENPSGEWQLRINDRSDRDNVGELKDFKLVLHGTYDQPDYIKDGPRVYETINEGIQSEKKDADLKDLNLNLELNDYLPNQEESIINPVYKHSYQSNEELSSLLDKLLTNFEKKYETSQYNLPDDDNNEEDEFSE